MGIFRNSHLLLRRDLQASDDAETGVFAVRPSDGDDVFDGSQRFVLSAFAEPVGAGSIEFIAWNSFGDGVWFLVGKETVIADGKAMYGFNALENFAPYLRVVARALPPDGSLVKPTFRAILRIASDGPYRLIHGGTQDTPSAEIDDLFEWTDRSKYKGGP